MANGPYRPQTAPGSPRDLAPGTQIGNYVVERRFASGGMAELFLAWQAGPTGFRRQVIIKRILPHYASDKEFLDMFLREASIAARLSHPNIVHIIEVLQEPVNDYMIVMEFVRGDNVRNIQKTLRKKGVGFSLGHVIRIVSAVCDALDYAYNSPREDGQPLQIVHRDVTPMNVLVSMEGQVKLVDFGIAKALQAESFTRAGTIRGKVSYMSPEQIQGRPLDARSDLFSVGVMLYEMTTGRRLFQRENDIAACHAILSEDVPPPSSVVPGFPQDLEYVIMKALERDREQRFATARELSRNLMDLARGEEWSTSAVALGSFMTSLFPEQQEQMYQQAHALQTGPSESLQRPSVPGTGEHSSPSSVSSQVQPGLPVHAGMTWSTDLEPDPEEEQGFDMDMLLIAALISVGCVALWLFITLFA